MSGPQNSVRHGIFVMGYDFWPSKAFEGDWSYDTCRDTSLTSYRLLYFIPICIQFEGEDHLSVYL